MEREGRAAGMESLSLRYPWCSATTLRSLNDMDEDVVNFELISELLKHICGHYPEGGAILVFLPGMQEISTLYELLLSDHRFFGDPAKFRISPLHSCKR